MPENGPMNVQQLENELWEAADQLRANSKLTAAEYAMPVLGLIFLRHADNRFKAYLPEIEADIPLQVPATQRETLIKLGFQGKAAIYLPETARFDRIASLPQGANVGEVIDRAVDVIEAEYEVLKGALPRGYPAFETDLLAELVKIFDRPAIKAATGDVFGRIYEYFLNKFAMSGAQEGGEFFTPTSLVQLIVAVIEPYHGMVYDPACGSGSLLLNFAKVLGHDKVRQGFFGQEINLTTWNLCRINMFLHDINYEHFDIAHGDTLIDPAHWDDEPFEAIVSNPPYSTKWPGSDNPLLINDSRFAPAGVLAPKSKAEPDYLELFGRLMQRMGDTLTEASAQPHAVELAKIEAIMHERSISAENERAKIHADLERDRMKAQGRSQWFTVGVMTICAAAVLGLVRLQQQVFEFGESVAGHVHAERVQCSGESWAQGAAGSLEDERMGHCSLLRSAKIQCREGLSGARAHHETP